MKVTVGSTNPTKVEAVRAVFAQHEPTSLIREAAVSSGVPEQPWGHEQTRLGARNRASRALGDDQFGVGIESGLLATDDGMMTINWCVLCHADGRQSVSQGFSYLLPPPVSQLIEQGLPLGAAIDRVMDMNDIRSGPGASGILTQYLVTRQQGYEQLVGLALAPFRRPDLYA